MTRYAFTAQSPSEWLSLETAARWLNRDPECVKHFVQDGKLRARTMNGLLQIDSTSVDALLPAVGGLSALSVPMQTFVKIGNRCYEELDNGKLCRIR